jgi:hypothetical protein
MTCDLSLAGNFAEYLVVLPNGKKKVIAWITGIYVAFCANRIVVEW